MFCFLNTLFAIVMRICILEITNFQYLRGTKFESNQSCKSMLTNLKVTLKIGTNLKLFLISSRHQNHVIGFIEF
ncbi:hypothetical protein GLYMA_03G005650v4 [Glycine max]|nr:hypothetical protein GLYMA_03G005650v4 [Glycine max]KAH1068028.1 hypothetical protein GYH30_005850 [Glycine max]